MGAPGSEQFLSRLFNIPIHSPYCKEVFSKCKSEPSTQIWMTLPYPPFLANLIPLIFAAPAMWAFQSFVRGFCCCPFLAQTAPWAWTLLPAPGMLPPLPRLTLPEPSAHRSAATSSWKPSQTSPLGSVWLHPTFLLLVTSYSHFVPVNIQLMFLFPSSTVSFTRAKLCLPVLPFGPQLLGQCLEYIRHSINSGDWFQFPCLPVILYRALLGIFPD